MINLIKKTQNSISFKILLGLLTVVLLSLIISFISISALKNTRKSQEVLTKKTLPLLIDSNKLSQTVFEYLFLLESLPNLISSQNIEENKEKIKVYETSIQKQLGDFKKNTFDQNYFHEVFQLLDEIFLKTKKMKLLVFNDQLSISHRYNQKRELLYAKIKEIRNTILRQRIVSSEDAAGETKLIVTDILEHLYSLNDYIKRDVNEISLKEILQLRIKYLNSVRKITQRNLLLEGNTLKISIAEVLNIFLEESNSKKGFLNLFLELKRNRIEFLKELQILQEKEKQLVKSLRQLLNKISSQTNNDIIAFDSIVEKSSFFIIFLTLLILLVSLGWIYIYIIPNIIQRLILLSENTQKIASEDYNVDINTDGNDEISNICVALEGFRVSLIAKQRTDILIQESEVRLRNIIENTVDGFFTINDTGVIKDFNPASEKIFGYCSSEVIGNNINSLIIEVLNNEVCDSMTSYKVNTQTFYNKTQEAIAKKNGGIIFPIDLAISKIVINDRVLYTGFVRDISEQKKMEHDLRESEERYNVAVRGSSVGLWDWQIAENKLFWSDRYKEIIGIYDDRFNPSFNEFLSRLHPDDKEMVERSVQDHLKNKEPFNVEYRLKHKDGRYMWIHAKGQAIWDSSGDAIRMAGSIDDISYKKNIEEDKEKLIKNLKASNEELERFAYICSHDLQEPLRMIRSFSEKLSEYLDPIIKDDDKGKKYFSFVIDGARLAQQLISDILSFSKMNHDMRKPEVFDVGEILDIVIKNITINSKQVDIEVTYSPMPIISGYKSQFYQLLQNLINNGIKYQKKRTSPKIYIDCFDREGFWEFSVRDNGIGMEERHFKKIFEVFRRLHRKNEYSGTGIGLAICKKVVENHEGSIWVNSNKNEGSVFYFTISKNLSEER